VPGGDLQRNHDQFVEDKSGKGDRDDMEEFVFEKDEGHDHYRRPLIETDHVPFEEGLVGQRTALGGRVVSTEYKKEQKEGKKRTDFG